VIGKNARFSQPRDYKLIVEKDVQIPLRDGRSSSPTCSGPTRRRAVPAIMSLTIYQKDKVWHPPADLEEAPNPYMGFECPNPLWWCPRGYALVRIDTRGAGKSPGQSNRVRTRRPSITTTRSSGSRGGHGAPEASARSASHTSPARSGV